MTTISERLYWSQYYGRQWLTGRFYGARKRFKRQPEIESEPKRVLFVAIGLLGDTVMCTPVINEARRL